MSRPLKELLHRAKNILFRPGDEWRAIRNQPADSPGIIFRYVAVLAAIPPVTAIAGRFLFEGNIQSGYKLSLQYLLVTNAMWYTMNIVNVVIAAVVVSAILATADSRWSALRGLTVSAYSFTPLFVAGFVSVIPFMAWSVYPAIMYGVYLLYAGIRSLTVLDGMKSAWYAGASFIATAVIIGVLSMFEYMLESTVAARML
jgi:Yip1 domain